MKDSILLVSSVVGVLGLAAGIFAGKKIKHRDTRHNLAGPRNSFSWFMRDVSLALRKQSCNSARRALAQATLAARGNKEQGSLVKAYRKIQRCESKQIEDGNE